MSEQVVFPLKLSKPGKEWIVELRGNTDETEGESACGLFHSTDEQSAKSFYDCAHRILSCWYVDLVWQRDHGKVGR